MSSRVTSEFGPLGARVARTREAEPHRPEPAATSMPRHVWVLVDEARVAGVLTQWRQGPTGWQGHVLLASDADTAVWRWFPAADLEPADTLG